MILLRPVAVVALLLAAPAHAGEVPLTGSQIAALLPTVAALGDGTRQTFEPDGSTRYTDPRGSSSGLWRVEGDRYCSQWSPGESWACYDVVQDGHTLIWIDGRGGRILNTLQPRN